MQVLHPVVPGALLVKTPVWSAFPLLEEDATTDSRSDAPRFSDQDFIGMATAAPAVSLFSWIEKREREHRVASDSSWGRVLDSGTGRHSLSWLLCGKPSSHLKEVVAVTGEKPLADALAVEFGPTKTPHATPLKIYAGNWRNDDFLTQEKPFDVIIADYLIGAIEGFAPYYQDRICGGLENMLAPGGRLYLVGLQPLSESYASAGASDHDLEAGKLIQEIARTRDACLLLAGRPCYREYPMDWSQRQLELAGMTVTNSVRFVNVYGLSAITRQLDVGRRHVSMFKDRNLAENMTQALDRLHERLETVFGPSTDEQRKIHFGFDYVIAARKLLAPSGVYRSGFPNRKNHAFLQQLGLKSVLYLCHQEHQPENVAFFQEHAIEVFQCPIDGNKHRTGCVIGCMRKMENWSLTSIIDEYCRFAGPRMRLLDQQFIEFFAPTIEYDERQKPKWLS
ncbi:hypothetical protein PsorP6_000941 [Peronosclerospora sorghi]|uniref:Uncharacterized protein n=1 Tax=Peronosclerospora sorghi TaxID=230839 RepID=A0ACC0WSE3_9STRA|nr:hypothetical protein PsorP6_000941 [Peronosclerospora sorghi]